MSTVLRDVRFGLRMLAKRPGHTAAAVLALGLGIGLTAAMFSIVNGTILAGLPFDQSDRIVSIGAENLAKNERQLPVDYHDFLEWRQRQTSFEPIAAFYATTVNLSGAEGKPERLDGGHLGAEVFPMLRVKPLLGRYFVAAEDRPGAPAVVVLGYGLWQSRFGGDAAVLGRTVRVNGEPATVIGVMPQDFAFPVTEDLWVPLRMDPAKSKRGDGKAWVNVIARLKDGVGFDRAQAEMDGIARALAAEYPATNKGLSARVKPFTEEFVGGPVRGLLFAMLGAVAFVLLLACANVASLMTARAFERTREIAIRSALGAGRGRVLRQILVESLLMSAAGALLGLGLAHVGLRAFNAALIQANANPPFWFQIDLQPKVLLFTLGATLAAGLISGLLPALQASRSEAADVLKDEGRGSTSLRMGRLSRFVVVFEVALSCLLLVCAGLMIRSVVKLRHLDLGFEKQGLLTFRIALYEADYPKTADRVALWDQLLPRLTGEAGVVAAAAIDSLPTNGSERRPYALDGRAYPTDDDLPTANLASISPGFFHAIGSRVLQGRDFGVQDMAKSLPVALVNQSFAARAWPGEDALGRRVRVGKGEDAVWRTVVGVVPDLQMKNLADQDHGPEGFYLPLAQECPERVSAVVRTAGDPLAFAPRVRDHLAALDPDLPIYFVRSMEQVLKENVFFFHLFGTLFAIFGGAALLLAGVGIYGVIAFSVHQRTQEIGVRMALGARQGDVLGMVLRQGLTQLAIGLGLGLALAVLAARPLGFALFQVEPADPVTFGGVAAVLAAIALFACLVPAQRAARVDPLVAIRYD